MRYSNSSASFLIFIIAAIFPISAQTAANSKPEPDVLLLTDGEKLIGQLESATGKSVIFKSNLVGVLTVEWSKIQELHSSEKFAAIPKDVKLRSGESTADVPRGTVAVTNQQLQVESGDNAPRTMPTGNLGTLVEEGSFDKAFHRASLLQGWKGGATVGLSLTEATQKNQSFSAALNLTRTVPGGKLARPAQSNCFRLQPGLRQAEPTRLAGCQNLPLSRRCRAGLVSSAETLRFWASDFRS